MEEGKRKLAHIEQIAGVKEIPGADKICTYEVLGWEVVDQKGKYSIGDKVIYIEIDSVLPDKPEFEFLRERKFRVRTIKLRGQVSQGLILPLNILSTKASLYRFIIGDDVTDMLEITKYLSPSEREEINAQNRAISIEKNRLKKYMMRYSWFRRWFLPAKKKSKFPYWVSKTDEERIQNIPHVLSQFANHKVYVTEKVDYQSVTFTGKMLPRFSGFLGRFFPKRYQFIVCSKNLAVGDKNSLYWQIAKKYNMEEILRENPTLTIQGEQGNTNVQGNKYGIKEPRLWVFNIIDHEKNYHYTYEEMSYFCHDHNLELVPHLKYCNLSEIGSTVAEVVEYSKGKSLIANIQREGIVVRCIENGKKLLSFKAINPNFLLKYSDE